MCGRFAQYSPLPELEKLIKIDAIAGEAAPCYNISPTRRVLSVIYHGENRLGLLNWGLVPFWAKDLSRASSLINARAETLTDKPSFRQAFLKRRCLIPADGFYEWKNEDGTKRPWYIRSKNGRPFFFAGLWETWRGAQDKYHSCTIITTAAGPSVRAIHHRMPVILKPGYYQTWLDPEIQNTEKLKQILQEGHVADLTGYPVSKRINSPSVDDPGCIEPEEEK